MEEERFTVWVGGGEINDNLLTKPEADALAEAWSAKGYDDVQVEEIK